MSRRLSVGLLLAALVVSLPLSAQEQLNRAKQAAWEFNPEIQALLLSMAAEIAPTMPAPRLFPEPPYTVGRNNSLYWANAETNSMLDSENIQGEVLFYEIRAYSDSTGQFPSRSTSST